MMRRREFVMLLGGIGGLLMVEVFIFRPRRNKAA